MPSRRAPRRTLAAAVALLAAAWGASVAQAPPSSSGGGPEYEKAARTILCDCGCHPQSVYDCACGRAAEMRDEIAALIAEGRTGDEVIAAYVERHGEQIRIAPTATGFNLVAWLGPGLLLAGAAVAMLLLLRRWRRRAPAAAPADAGRNAAADHEYLERLRVELREYDT